MDCVNTLKNHNIWLNKIKWKVAYNEFESIDELFLDCCKFVFINGIKDINKQQKLVDFIGDSDHLNSLIITDFCVFFLKNDIDFKLSFHYSSKRKIMYNLSYIFIINDINKKIKKIKKR